MFLILNFLLFKINYQTSKLFLLSYFYLIWIVLHEANTFCASVLKPFSNISIQFFSLILAASVDESRVSSNREGLKNLWIVEIKTNRNKTISSSVEFVFPSFQSFLNDLLFDYRRPKRNLLNHDHHLDLLVLFRNKINLKFLINFSFDDCRRS